MGYTHYWNPTPPSLENIRNHWPDIRRHLELVMSEFADIVCYETSEMVIPGAEDTENKPPQLDDHVIRFNGKGYDGHETFLFDSEEVSDFNFCKTARKPYDIPVSICLLILSGYGLDLSSDGFFDPKDKLKVEGDYVSFLEEHNPWRISSTFLEEMGWSVKWRIDEIRKGFKGAEIIDFIPEVSPPPGAEEAAREEEVLYTDKEA